MIAPLLHKWKVSVKVYRWFMDIAYLALTVLFFVITLAFVAACEKLRGQL